MKDKLDVMKDLDPEVFAAQKQALEKAKEAVERNTGMDNDLFKGAHD